MSKVGCWPVSDIRKRLETTRCSLPRFEKRPFKGFAERPGAYASHSAKKQTFNGAIGSAGRSPIPDRLCPRGKQTVIHVNEL